VHAGSQPHQNYARARVPERRYRPAVIVRFLDVDGVQKCRKTRAAPAISIKNRIHAREGVSQRPVQRKNGLRGSPRSPPSFALGLWTNPSATEPGPEGLRTRQTPASGKKFLAGAKFFVGFPSLSGFSGALGLGCGEGSRSRITPAVTGASRVFKNCLPCSI
jgi:hypothetical protein